MVEEKNSAENGSEAVRKPVPNTSGRAKSFKKHCWRCRKYFDHRHTPDTFNTPCDLCPCTYFWGFEQYLKKKGLTEQQYREMREKRPAAPAESPADTRLEVHRISEDFEPPAHIPPNEMH